MAMSRGRLRRKYFAAAGGCVAVPFGLGFLFFATVVGFFFATSGDREAAQDAAYRAYIERGATATGVVTASRPRVENRGGGGKGGPQTVTVYDTAFEFPAADGRRYTGRETLGTPVAKGTRVPVMYLSDTPNTNRLNYEPPRPSSYEGRIISGALMLVFGGLAVLMVFVARTHWRDAGRRADLVLTGEHVEGIVTGYTGPENMTAKYRGLTYEYTAADGEPRAGACKRQPTGGPYGPGDSLTIVVDPDDPARHEVDVYGVRRGGDPP